MPDGLEIPAADLLAAAISDVIRPVVPDDPDTLKDLVGRLVGEVNRLRENEQRTVLEIEQRVAREVEQRLAREFEQRLQEVYEQIRLQRCRMFGRSSEAQPGQAALFNEAETVADQTGEATVADQAMLPASAPATPVAAAKATKPRGKRLPLPAELPRVDIIHEVPEAERTCACGTQMVEIGTEVSEQLDIVPMQIRVLRHIRKRYGCVRSEHAPATAPVAPQILPKSNASADLLAMLLTTKYVDGLPLARFEYVLARHGVLVPRQTLARWVIGTAQALQPLVNLMRDHLLESPVIHADETTVQVNHEPGRKASTPSYMWVQCGGPPGRPVVMFDYAPSRSAQVPRRLLEGWRGYLMTDGYTAYQNAIADLPGVEHLGCLVHARRKFMDAIKAQPAGRSGRADQAVEFIRQLYHLEKTARDLTDAQRQAMREECSKPILKAMRAWLDTNLPLVPPSTKLGEALAYLDKYWPRLIRFTERGDLPLDNNRAENALRPFVVGRKAWLFADTPSGAHASAVIYSLIETAKANNQEPYLWLRRVLRRLPAAKTADEFEALLPWNVHGLDLASDPVP